MNQTCKVCGEPAAGFHFGAFTCEGCKSFFGRSYNNMGSISECKNNNECTINKKNRTACKACRLRKCMMVGMSKSGSRYGRRSNWFKIHCLLQEQQQQQANMNLQQSIKAPQPNHRHHIGMLSPFPPGMLHLPRTKEELMLLGLDEYNKNSISPSVSSPESHNSDSSIEGNDGRRVPFLPGLFAPGFLPPPPLMFPSNYTPIYTGLLQPAPAENTMVLNQPEVEAYSKRIFLDAVLQSQRAPTPEEVESPTPTVSPVQEDPIDLSMKTLSERGSSPAQSDKSGSAATERGNGSEADESDFDSDKELKRIVRPTPLDLTRKA